MNFIKYHWFGLIVSAIVLFFIAVFFIVLIAPRYDEQKRGFVACTAQMAGEIQNCESDNLCVLGKVIENTFCNISVIKDGFLMWKKGEQNTPWANYLYEPLVKQQSTDDDIESEESLEEYYKSVPNIKEEMKNLENLNKKLEVNEDEEQ